MNPLRSPVLPVSRPFFPVRARLLGWVGGTLVVLLFAAAGVRADTYEFAGFNATNANGNFDDDAWTDVSTSPYTFENGPPGPNDEAIIGQDLTAENGSVDILDMNGNFTVDGQFDAVSLAGGCTISGLGTLNVLTAYPGASNGSAILETTGGNVVAQDCDADVFADGGTVMVTNFLGSSLSGDAGGIVTMVAAQTDKDIQFMGGSTLNVPGLSINGNNNFTLAGAGSKVNVNGQFTATGAGGFQITGGTLSVTGTLTLDGDNEGSFEVPAGGQVTGSGSSIMAAALTIGSLPVVGGGTDASSPGFSLQVADAAIVNVPLLNLGTAADTNGQLTITGANSLVQTGSVTIGDQGAGDLELNSGGALQVNGGDIRVGNSAGGQGTINASAGGSLFLSTNVVVGGNGSGDVEITMGGQMIFGSGPVRLFAVGLGSGPGVINVSGAGSTLNAHTAALNLGESIGSNGAITVGDGASMIFGGGNQTIIGDAGEGEISVSEGAQLTFKSAVAKPKLIIGKQKGSAGVLYVDSGQKVDLRSAQVTLGAQKGSNGTINVYDKSKLLLAGKQLFIGDDGKGDIEIASGGKVTVGNEKNSSLNFGVGTNPGSTGKVSVSGAGSTLTLNPGVISAIGFQGQGSMTVSSGAKLLNDVMYLAPYNGSKGSLTLQGKGTTCTNQDQFFLGRGTAKNEAGKATVKVLQSAELRTCLYAGAMIYIAQGSEVILDSTGRIVDGQGAFGPPGSLLVTAPGKLAGPGKVVGKVILPAGGRFEPGGGQGSFTIDGDFDQTGGGGGEMDFQVGGTEPGIDHDQLVINGQAKLGGTLKVHLVNGYAPKVGDTLALIQAASLHGNFTKVISTGVKLGVQPAAAGLAVKVLDVEPGLPVQTSLTRASTAPGQAFSYHTAATNKPTTYTAVGLPAGLSVNRATGEITGTPKTSGHFPVVLGFASETGIGEGMLDLEVTAAPAWESER